MIGAALSVLRVVPIWAWALAACLAWGGFQRHQAHAAAATLAKAEKSAADKREADLRESQAKTQAILTEQMGVSNAANIKAARASAAAASAAAAAQRLRDGLAAVDGRQCAADPAAAAASGAASSPADLRTYVQRRLDEAADGIARFADQSSIAGDACVGSYQALKPPKGQP